MCKIDFGSFLEMYQGNLNLMYKKLQAESEIDIPALHYYMIIISYSKAIETIYLSDIMLQLNQKHINKLLLKDETNKYMNTNSCLMKIRYQCFTRVSHCHCHHHHHHCHLKHCIQ